MIGLLDVTRTVTLARDMPALLQSVFQQAGFGDYTNDAVADVIGPIVIGVNVVGLVVAIALTVPRLREHRLAFWIPLAVGVACVVITSLLMLGAAVADPAFTAQVMKGSSGA